MLRSSLQLLRSSLPFPNTSSVNSVVANPLALHSRCMHLTSNLFAERRDLRTYRMTMPSKDLTLHGEKSIEIDSVKDKKGMFPDKDTPNRVFDGVLFKELPIFNIKACKNNTIITMSDFKATNIAAQTTAISISTKALVELGVRTARVRVQGIGPGRMSAIKGLQMGGINIVCITDNTHVSWAPPRARKQRRV
ncbi:unnamed protein product [Trichogramma brassicae]|uniref:Ribosomal protein S11 n=1 Tax=Trichogramma brassicae TaxID=86971 RepID=A0A6H5J4X5_9HYME|nr:unnamed protein product [Trichogramma brassicae]